MPPPTAPPTGGRPGAGLAAYLRTREGRIVAGGGAVVLVVMVALLRRGGGGAPFTAEGLQTGPDGTLQDRLDQLGLRGGSLEELLQSTADLTGHTAQLNDRLDQLAKKPPDLKAQPTKGRIRFSWNAVPGASSYQVRREVSGKLTGISTRAANLLTYDWQGVKPGGGYGLHVRAVYDDGTFGPWSRLVSPGA